jgi:hypothetical protein
LEKNSSKEIGAIIDSNEAILAPIVFLSPMGEATALRPIRD